jgi:uncharacterized protein (TIGR02246 family)
MKTATLAAAFGLLGVFVGRGLGAAQSAPVEQELARLKQQVVEAYVARDAKALAHIYADDFSSTNAQGRTRTKADELKDLSAPSGERLESGRYEPVKVRVFGDVAVMSGHGNLRWAGAGEARDSRYYSFNVFVKRDGRWQYVAAFTP